MTEKTRNDQIRSTVRTSIFAALLLAALSAATTNIQAFAQDYEEPANEAHPSYPGAGYDDQKYQDDTRHRQTYDSYNAKVASMYDHKYDNITGSIKVLELANMALNDDVDTTLSEAIENAVDEVGDDAVAVAAHLTVVNEYLAYKVIVLGSDGKVYIVIVDAGDDGDVLDTQSFTLKQLIAMIHHGGYGEMSFGHGAMMYGPPMWMPQH